MNIGGVEWRNFKRRLVPMDEKEQGQINKKLCDYIYQMNVEIQSLKKDIKRLQKGEAKDGTEDNRRESN